MCVCVCVLVCVFVSVCISVCISVCACACICNYMYLRAPVFRGGLCVFVNTFVFLLYVSLIATALDLFGPPKKRLFHSFLNTFDTMSGLF